MVRCYRSDLKSSNSLSFDDITYAISKTPIVALNRNIQRNKEYGFWVSRVRKGLAILSDNFWCRQIDSSLHYSSFILDKNLWDASNFITHSFSCRSKIGYMQISSLSTGLPTTLSIIPYYAGILPLAEDKCHEARSGNIKVECNMLSAFHIEHRENPGRSVYTLILSIRDPFKGKPLSPSIILLFANVLLIEWSMPNNAAMTSTAATTQTILAVPTPNETPLNSPLFFSPPP